MTRMVLLACLFFAIGTKASAAEEAALAGEWRFSEGRDNHVLDSSPNANHGVTAGGTGWSELIEGYAMQFAAGGYVNCGRGPSLDLRGPVSLSAWVFPLSQAPSETGICGKSFDSYAMTLYTDGNIYWYIGSGGNKCAAPLPVRQWSHIAGTFDGAVLCLYVDGQLLDTTKSEFTTVPAGGDFYIGCIDSGHGRTDSFNGVVSHVRAYNRALAAEEIRDQFDSELPRYPGPPPQADHIVVTAYNYLDEGRVVFDGDFSFVYPLRDGERAWFELRAAGQDAPLARHELPSLPKTAVLRDIAIEVGALSPGEYEARVSVEGPEGVRSVSAVPLRYSTETTVPSPASARADALPVPAPAPEYACDIQPGGGLSVTVGEYTFAIDSTFSYPHGGMNGFVTGPSDALGAEQPWRVETARIDGNRDQVSARGAFYSIERRIERAPGRIFFRDTITNTSTEDVGIRIDNSVRASGPGVMNPVEHPNAAAFLSGAGSGLGMIALDDVYLEHHETYGGENRIGICDAMFGLAAGASYTIEWAVYLNGTGDYFDFVNAARADLGFAPRIEGGFAFVDRREPPDDAYVLPRNLKYASIGCLGNVPDDPGLSIEGVEFIEYPQECALLKQTFADTRRRYPDMTVMFHIAHSLYTTNRPEEVFSDARVIDANGAQTDYGGQNVKYYIKYFSEERVNEGYRWYIFYPTMENSFGKYMLDAIDYMLDDLGVNGMFADGFSHGYGGRYTYDRWDGHTVALDPETKTIARKFASVNLLAQDVLVETVRRVRERGGVVIANSYPGTRTIHQQEGLLYCLETAGGGKVCTRLYFTPSVIALGNPANLETDRDVYEDLLDKLQWGALYFYYGEKTVAPGTIVAHMYPITVAGIGRGIVRGPERIITMNSGVYGWPGDSRLHYIHFYDGRGVPRPHGFITTAGPGSARTNVSLATNESAVVEPMPARIEADAEANTQVVAYGADGIDLVVHTAGPATLRIETGPFAIRDGAAYTVTLGENPLELHPENGVLSVPIPTPGQTRLRIQPPAQE